MVVAETLRACAYAPVNHAEQQGLRHLEISNFCSVCYSLTCPPKPYPPKPLPMARMRAASAAAAAALACASSACCASRLRSCTYSSSACTSMCARACVHVCVYVCVYVGVFVHVCVWVCAYKCVRVIVFVSAHARTAPMPSQACVAYCMSRGAVCLCLCCSTRE